jgi:hypothetical protein
MVASLSFGPSVVTWVALISGTSIVATVLGAQCERTGGVLQAAKDGAVAVLGFYQCRLA